MVQRNHSWEEESIDVTNFVVVSFEEIATATPAFRTTILIGQQPSTLGQDSPQKIDHGLLKAHMMMSIFY